MLRHMRPWAGLPKARGGRGVMCACAPENWEAAALRAGAGLRKVSVTLRAPTLRSFHLALGIAMGLGSLARLFPALPQARCIFHRVPGRLAVLWRCVGWGRIQHLRALGGGSFAPGVRLNSSSFSFSPLMSAVSSVGAQAGTRNPRRAGMSRGSRDNEFQGSQNFCPSREGSRAASMSHGLKYH